LCAVRAGGETGVDEWNQRSAGAASLLAGSTTRAAGDETWVATDGVRTHAAAAVTITNAAILMMGFLAGTLRSPMLLHEEEPCSEPWNF
jgi:hypothetical protein